MINLCNWMSKRENQVFKSSGAYPVIFEFIKENDLKESAVNAFASLDTKRIELLVSQFINRCEHKGFKSFLEAYQE
jgi:hypothetical protein